MKACTRFTGHVCLLLLLAASDICAQSNTPQNQSTLTPAQQATLDQANQLAKSTAEFYESKKFDEALPLAQRVVELRRSVLGDTALVADATANVAVLYLAKRDFERAEAHYRKALTIYERVGLANSNVARVLDSLGLLHWRVREFSKAEMYVKRAMSVREQLYGDQAPELLESINNLIKIYHSAGRTSERNALYLRVISTVEKRNDGIPDREALFRYLCTLRESEQTSDVVDIQNRLEALLKLDSAAKRPPSPAGRLNGRAVSLVKPAFPAEAKASYASGAVVVEVVIDECGKVIKADAVSGEPLLRRASEVAAMASRFTPTMVNGFPVKVKGTIHYNFAQGP